MTAATTQCLSKLEPSKNASLQQMNSLRIRPLLRWCSAILIVFTLRAGDLVPVTVPTSHAYDLWADRVA